MSGAAFVSLAALRAEAPAWRRLCAQAAPNPFAEPDFLLPLIDYQRPRGLRLALMRSADERLIGFAAVIAPPAGLARVWMSAYAALPAIVLDRDSAPEALAALLALLRAHVGLSGLVWPFANGADVSGLPFRSIGRRRRAALRLGGGVAGFEASLDSKRRSKWARGWRKLAARGQLGEIAGADAVEAFFAVEAKGWKGKRRTALADDPARLGFARAMLGAFAAAGRLDALGLTLDGAPIAAGLVLTAGSRAFYWKTAYDEAYAEASPGVQLTLLHSRRLAATAGLELVDSCAAEDHPMIGRVWADEIAFEDFALGLGSESGLRFWLAAARATAAARDGAKRLRSRLRGWRNDGKRGV